MGAPRRPSSRRRTTRPSAPCSWAVPAPPPSATSTSTEIPSPSAIAWLSRRAPVTDRDATRSGRRRGGRAADAVGCGGGRACQARLPARCRVDREDHARACAGGGVRHGLEPRVRPSLHRDRPRSGGAVDERRVHPHRPDPVLVRGLPRRLGARGALLRHGRVHDGAVPPGLPRRADARVRRPRSSAATTSTSSAGSTCRGGTTGSGSSRSSGTGCTSATSSGRGRAGRRGCSSRGRWRSGCAQATGASVDAGSTCDSCRSGAGSRRDRSRPWIPKRERHAPRPGIDRSPPRLRCRPDARRSSARGRPRSPTGSARCRRGRRA